MRIGRSVSRPIRLAVPFTPGGPTDILALNLAEAVRPMLKQSAVVENKLGAGGNIGATEVARSASDGLTLLFGTTPQYVINVSVYKTLGFNPIKSFEPVIWIGDLPNILIVNPKVPAPTLPELAAHARRPGQLRFASAGNGTTSDLSGVFFNERTGTKFTHIPHRWAPPGIDDGLAGHVELTFVDVLTAKPLMEAGSVVPIGVTTRERSPALPNVPSMEEQGAIGPRRDGVLRRFRPEWDVAQSHPHAR